MGFESNDLGVLGQHCVGMQFLISLIAGNTDVDTVTQTDKGILIGRLVVFVMEAEADFQMSGGITAVGMQMYRVGNDGSTGFQ